MKILILFLAFVTIGVTCEGQTSGKSYRHVAGQYQTMTGPVKFKLTIKGGGNHGNFTHTKIDRHGKKQSTRHGKWVLRRDTLFLDFREADIADPPLLYRDSILVNTENKNKMYSRTK